MPGVPNVEGDFWSYAVAVDANIEYRAAQIDVFFRLVALGQGHAAAYADQTDEIKRLQAKYKAEYQAIAIWAWALAHPDIPATPQPVKQTPPTTAPNVPWKPVPQSPKYELGPVSDLASGLWEGMKDLPGETLAALKSALSAIFGVAKDVGACGASVVDAVGDTISFIVSIGNWGEPPHLPECPFDNTTAIVDGMLEALSGVKDAIGEAVSSGDATAVVIALGGLFAGLDTKACEKHSILYCLGKAAPAAIAAAGTTWAAGKLLKKFKTQLNVGKADQYLPGLREGAPKPLGLGSTGRTKPANLAEQLAMTEVRSAPGGIELDIQMTDSRWQSDGNSSTDDSY